MTTQAARPIKTLKLHREHTIAIGFALLAAASYFGYQGWAAYQVDGTKFPTIEPGRASIVGINPGSGYRIIVANQVAQLLQTNNNDLSQAEQNYDAGEDDAEGPKKRVPLKELLLTLKGDEKALGKLVTAMNDDLRKIEMPAVEVAWTAEDIKRALDGDVGLRDKLEKNLNVHLDGSPLDQIRTSALDYGIVVVCKVPVEVAVAGQTRQMLGEIRVPFKPNFVEDVLKRYAKTFNPTPAIIKGNYLDVAHELEENPRAKQDVARTLRDMIDPQALRARYADGPTRILSNAFVVLNENQIEKASFQEKDVADGKKLYDMELQLSDEGRRRLWQFSRRKPGAQLLVIVDGIAIAAPRIRHELSQSTISITQIQDRGLVEDATDLINSLRKTTQ